MTDLVFRGGRVLRDGAWVAEDLWCRDGRIVAAADGAPAADIVDVAGCRLAPGYVDLQCNGAVGIDLTADPSGLWDLAATLPRWGVTSWLPTIVTSPPATIERAIEVLAAGPPAGWRGARPVGLHLEGPFLAPEARGAHPASLLRPPSVAAVAGWSRAGGVAMVTLAPDLPGAAEVQAELLRHGVLVSIGHTRATAATATAAVDGGARAVTHLFNAMGPLHHREPGLAGVALTDDRLVVGLIADGVHVDPMAVTVAQRALGERLALVTDAVAPLGLPLGSHDWGGTRVSVDERSVRLVDGTLAGSVLSLDTAVRNLVAFTGCTAAEAVGAASSTPARLLGDRTVGSLAPGSRADVVLLTDDLHIVGTYIDGHAVHDARWSTGPTASG
jgi:N-acetylglucosamine-6-phosphate deacetylase